MRACEDKRPRTGAVSPDVQWMFGAKQSGQQTGAVSPDVQWMFRVYQSALRMGAVSPDVQWMYTTKVSQSSATCLADRHPS
jgi:hypothetical protein